MNKKLLLAVCAIFIVYACNKKNATVDTNVAKPVGKTDINSYAMMGLDSPFLLPDTANIMIQSYLNSIKNDPTQLKSLIVDAGALRYYLQNPDITHVKLMFAHRMNYIHAGHEDQPADGLDYNAMTLVITAFDANGNYIYTPEGAVMDHCRPCPVDCPTVGTASSDIIMTGQ
ncbi:MAG TPA: hypothetical protein VEB40_14640 [Flavipsychrobacter sp.]|nr:hypothetical protein [Flavipsychrobacter sp.]